MSFQPRFITEDELGKFKLPSPSDYPKIMQAVDEASTLIDEHCCRVYSGSGSLVYSTYTERKRLITGRTSIKLSFRPLVALTASLAEELAATGSTDNEPDDNLYTGFEVNTESRNDELSPLVSLKIRNRYPGGLPAQETYGQFLNYNDMAVIALTSVSQDWTDVDLTLVDFDKKSGEVWLPGTTYGNEVEAKYNSGFDPRAMPRGVKFACAAIIQNAMLRGGATAVKGISGAAKMNMNFTEELIDSNIERWLQNYVVAIAR